MHTYTCKHVYIVLANENLAWRRNAYTHTHTHFSFRDSLLPHAKWFRFRQKLVKWPKPESKSSRKVCPKILYWRMQNNCTASDRLKRFVFQRCRLLLVVNVKKKHAQCNYATLYGYETVARRAIILHTPVPRLSVFFFNCYAVVNWY
jgi:hypothetical protein